MVTKLLQMIPPAKGMSRMKDTRESCIFVPERIRALCRRPSGETALARIEAALVRLDLGTFGLCTCCGEQINLKRLDRDPSDPRCARCARVDGVTTR